MRLSFKLQPIEAKKGDTLPVPTVISSDATDGTCFVQLTLQDKRGGDATRYLSGTKTKSAVIDANSGKLYFIFEGLSITEKGDFKLVANLFGSGATGSDFIDSKLSKTIKVKSSGRNLDVPEISGTVRALLQTFGVRF